MKNLLHAGRFLAQDMASTLFFLVLFQLTHNLPLAIGVGMALGVGQVAWTRLRGERVDAMQWLSLALVVGFGGATLLTHDARFVMLKPTLVYLMVAAAMMKPGWMVRYLPPVAMEVVPDLGVVFGYVWAGMMAFSAVLNLALAFTQTAADWAAAMSLWGLASKPALFLVQYATMRAVGVRRRRLALAAA